MDLRVSIVLFLSILHVNLYGQLVTTGCDEANFGVDGEVFSNWALYGNNSSVPNNVDDWFTNISLAGSGINVIDDSDNLILFPQLAFGNNITYTGRMSLPNGSVVGGNLLLDAVYMRDFHGGNLDIDSSAFFAGYANGMDPNTWVKDDKAMLPRNDIIDTYAHLRRKGGTVYDSLYFFFALSRVANVGTDYFDVELFAKDIQQTGGGFTSSGVDDGHTSWQFDAGGNVTQIGDILISFDFEASFMPFVTVFIWVSNADYTTATPSKFSFGPQFYGSGAFGYADLALGADFIGCGLRNTGNAWPPPWGTINSSGLYSALYEPFQLTELGINLSLIGLDPAMHFTMDPCDEAFESVMFKSRSNFLLNSQLLDYVGPEPLGPIPPIAVSINGDTFYDCDLDTLTVNIIESGASYFWSTTGGNIISRTDSSSIVIDAPGEYRVEGISSVGCSVFDTILITSDNINPTFTVPSDTILYQDASCFVDTTTNSTGIVFAISDNQDTDPQISYADAITTNCEGTFEISRTWQVTDDCGNSSTAIQTINVSDTIVPTFTIPSDTIVYFDNACFVDTSATATGNVFDSMDNCDSGPSAVYSDIVVIGCGEEYIITRTWQLSDDCANMSSGIQTITVLDTIEPFFSVPNDTIIYDCSADTTIASIGDVLDENDNCDITIGQAIYLDSIAVLCEGSYTIYRKWRLADICGNQALQTQTITISDTTRPTFTVPPDTLVYQDTLCSRTFLPSEVGDVLDESDNCDTSLEATYVDNIINGSCIGALTIERTWSLTDDCGNTSTALQIITVVDDIPPIFNQTVSDFTMECSDFFAGPPVITATDGCDTTVVAFQEVLINNASIVVEEDFNVSASGTLIPIVVTGLDNVQANVFQSLSLSFSTNKGKGRAYFVLIAPSGDAIVLVGNFCEGGFCDGGSEVYSPTFYACSLGNPVWNNVDSIPDGPGDFSPHGGPNTVGSIPHATNFVDCFEDFTGPMVGTWHVWTKKNKTSNGRIQGLGVDFTVAQHECLDPGYYSRKWVASDDCGNTNVMYQFISITDTEGPTFTVPGDTTLYYDSNCNFPDTTLASTGDILNAFDWCDDSLTIVRADSIANLACHLEYQIYRKWTLTDKCDNSSSQIQIITILDIPPLMTCPPDTVLTCENPVFPAFTTFAEFVAAGGTISDNCEIVESSFMLLSEISDGNSCPEIITRTYQISDTCGYTAICQRIITVNDTARASFTVPPDVQVYLDGACFTDTTTANTGDVVDESDNCSSALEATYTDAIVSACGSTYQINRSWTVVDDCGNSFTQIQSILVSDTLSPSFSVPADLIVFDCGADTTTLNTGDVIDETDNCSTNLEASYADVVVGGCVGSYTVERTWTLTDDCGNTTSQLQTITITDTTSPTFTIPVDTLLYITVGCVVDTSTVGTGDVIDETDNCDTNLEAIYTDLITPGCGGGFTITRTWSLSDDCGNARSEDQVITVLDTILPTFTVPVDISLFKDAICNADTTTIGTGDVTDESSGCSLGLDAVYTDSIVLTCTDSYTIYRIWTLDNGCGNSITQIQTIQIIDTIAPVLVGVPLDTIVDCSNIPLVPVVTATDNCSSNLTVNFSEIIGTGCPFTITRTWEATDDCGNQTIRSQNLLVEDISSPVFANVPADTTIDCITNLPPMVDLSWTDDCTGSGTVTGVDKSILTVSISSDRNIDSSGTVNSELMNTGSYVINMGVVPQTVDNGLKPYGLMYNLLRNYNVPIKWVIQPGKSKDGIDFSENGIDYRGGPFIIPVEYITTEVDSVIGAWESQGVIGNKTTSPVTVPVYRTVDYIPHWGLDLDNGNIAEKFFEEAEIPESAYQFVLPTDLDSCYSIFVLPHADPNWGSHANLYDWNKPESEGGNAGAVWMGCHSVSEIENSFNPVDPTKRLNFLMQDPIAPETNPAVPFGDHDDGSPAYQYAYHDHPIMQFMGTLDDATENGSEQVFLPTNGWRSTTKLGVWDDTQADIPSLSPGPAGVLVFGQPYGDPNRGIVSYTGGHNIRGNDPENVAAMRSFFNFSFFAAGLKAIDLSISVPTLIESGQSYAVSATASGGVGQITYEWQSECPGTFANPNAAITTFTPDASAIDYSCRLSCIVRDECNIGTSFLSYEIEILATSGGDCSENVYRCWTYTDDCGNETMVYQTITIRDTIAPIINIPGDTTVQCDAVPAVPVVIPTDNCTTNLILNYNEVIGTGCPYIITRTWDTTDDCGNTTSQTQTITVTDTISPSFTAPADLTLYDCNGDTTIVNTGDVIDETDGCSTNLEAAYTDVVIGGCGGSYTVERTWTLTDDCGNTLAQLQTITITDTTSPSFTVPIDTLVYIAVGCVVDTSITGTGDVVDESDNCDTNLSAIYTDLITPGCGGGFTIVRTWSLSDDCGNVSLGNQVITVLDTLPPIFTVPLNTSLFVDAVCNADTTTASTGNVTDESSSCSLGLEAVYADSIVLTCTDSYTIYRIWTLDDGCSNTSTQIQTITVSDTISPSFTVPADITVYDCGSDTTVVNTGDVVDEADNCSSALEATYSDTVVGGCTGSYSISRTWTLSDNCGNATSQIQTITVTDTISPSFTAPSDITVYDCGGDTTIVNTGDVLDESDNCSTNLEAAYADVVVGGCVGSYTVERTWTLTDDCGNTSAQLQTITITDTTSPSFTVPIDTILYIAIGCVVDTSITGAGDVVDESDNCDIILDAVYTDLITPGCGGGFTIVRTWSLSDDCGNATSGDQVITVLDTLPPTFSAPSDTSLYLDAACTVDTTTSITGDVTDEFASCSLGHDAIYADSIVFSCSDSYTIFRIWTLDAGCSNSSTQIQTITVLDTISPSFTVPADITVYDCGSDTTIVNTGDVVDEADNCSTGIEATYSDTVVGGCTGSYTISRTWTLADNCGNTTSQIQTITVTDTISPSFTAPADITVFDCGGDTTIVNTGDVLDEVDNCSTNLEAAYSDVVSGGCIGSYTVQRTWTLTDDCGNATAHLQTITITDTTSPSFTVPIDTLLYIAIGCVVDTSITGTGDVVDESDNCDTNLDAVYTDLITSGCGGGFTITRTWSLSDDCGNTTSGDQLITIVDTIPPTFTSPPDTILYVDAVCNADTTTASTGDVTDESSSCSIGLDAIYADSIVFNCPDSYTIFRIWRLDDGCSNSTTQIQTISVSDTISPSFTVPLDITLYDCGADTSVLNTGDVLNESDNCSLGIQATYSDGVIAGCSGTYTISRTWTLADNCGNTTSQIQTITVTDTISPSFTAPVDITVFDCGGDTTIVNTGDVLDEVDNCSTNLEAAYSDVVSGGCIGSYTVQRTWTLTDDCGNATAHLQTITITDTTSPSFTVPIDTLLYIAISCVVDTSITGTGDVVDENDNCDTNLDAVHTDLITPGCGGGFTITRTWSLSDDCGNTTSGDQVITILDTIPPTFTAPSDTILYVDAVCNADTTTASTGDVTDESSSCSIGLDAIYADSIVYNCPDTYTIYRIWRLDDGCSNSTTQIQTISVSDTISPSFTVPLDITLYDCGADTSVLNTGDVLNESDNCSLGIQATYSDGVIAGCSGTYTISRTWTLSDNCGNTTSQVQTITVTDTISPSFSVPADITIYDCNGDTTIVNTGDVLDEMDNCSTSLEAAYSDVVSGGCIGSYTVQRTWTLTDDCGNATTQLQTITITDTTSPSFTVPIDTLLYIAIGCAVDTSITGTGDVLDENDNCDTNLDAVYTDLITPGCGGGFTITRTWSLFDDCGNTTSGDQVITILDTIPPTFTTPSDTILYVDAGCNVDTTTTSTGDVIDESSSCSASLDAIYADSIVLNCPDSYTIYRIWTLDDGCSNSSTQIQTISISDTISPTFTVPADITVYDCGADTTIVNTGDVLDEFDNCSSGIQATYSDGVIGGCTGSYTISRTWTLADNCGNTTSQVQTITVTDTISPSFTAPADITVYDCGGDTTIVNTGDVLDEMDNCSTSLEAAYSDVVSGGCIGSYTVQRTWTLTDDCGNATAQLQTITITDTTSPSFTVPIDTLLYIAIGCVVDTSITGTGDVVDESDNCDTNLDAVYTDLITPGCGGGFMITRTWSLSDDCGNTTSGDQVITVLDTIPPTFTVPSDTALYVDTVCIADTTTASTGDVTDESSSCSSSLDAIYADSIVFNCPDSYTLYRIWTLDDGCSNTSTQIQTITVSDTISPSFTVPADITVFDCGSDTTVINTGDVVDEADNCSTGIEATYSDIVVGGCTGSYTISRTWTLADNCGNTTSQIQTITVTDTISPSFTAPADITVFDCGGDTTIVNTGDVLDEMDNCSTNLEAAYSDVVSGGCIGSYTVQRTWTLTDDCGNATTQLQTITITDTTSPSFTVPIDTLLYIAIGCVVDTSITGTGDVLDENDNCDTNLDAVYTDLITPGCGSGFTITRTWNLSDDCGNTTSGDQLITILDTIPPTFTTPSDTLLYVDVVCYADTTTTSTGDVTDESSTCSSSLDAIYADSIVINCPDSYTIFRIWRLDDGCSNSTTQIQTISVTDTISPSFTVPLDITLYDCGADTTVLNTGDVLDESDNCSSGIQATYSDGVIAGCTGSYTISRTWTLSDNCGNTTTQIQTITVTDTISPSFTVPVDITIYDCGGDTTISNTGDVLDEMDNCSTNLEAVYSDVVVGGCVGSSTVQRTWTLTDDCGNTTAHMQTITITDTASPSFTVPIDTLLYIAIGCVVDTSITGTGDVVDENDNCDTNLNAVYTDLITPGCGGGFTITRTWSLSDDCGNTTSVDQVITILDTIPPTFTAPSDTLLYVDVVCYADTTTASTGDVTNESSTCSSSLDAIYADSIVINCPDSYTIFRIWTLDDGCSNSSTQIQTITVTDTISPSFTVPLDITLYDCGADTTVLNTGDALDESDNCSSGIQATYSDGVIAGCTGSYTISRTWTLSDNCGNTTSQIQTITVTDTISPSFTVPADITIYDCGGDTTISNTGDVLDEMDNCSTNLEAVYSDVVVGGCVGSSTVQRTWTLTDDCGNTTAQLQTITITDTTSPSFTVPIDTLLYLAIGCVVDTSITGTGDVVDENDNCDTNLDAVYTDLITPGCGGGFTITRTWSLSDDCGNATSVDQVITILDTIPPTFTAPSDTLLYVDVVCYADTTTASTGDVTNESSTCSSSLDAIYADSIVINCPDSYTIFRIWTLDDGCSNSSTQIQTITVSDSIRPSFTVPADITVYDCGADTTITNTGDVLDESDNCSSGIQATYSDGVIGGCTGSYTISRTWTLADNCGNTTSQVQTITVTDTISPSFTAPADITVYDCGGDTTIVNTGDVLDEVDNCSTNLEAAYSDVVVGGCVGSYTVERTWTLTDDCGNISAHLQTITITDTTSPSFTVPTDTLLYLAIGCVVDTSITGTGDVIDEGDNCDTNLDAVYTDLITPGCGGGFTITRTWSLSDDCGNATFGDQVITVLDTIPPTFTAPADILLYVDAGCSADTTTASTGDVTDESSGCSLGLEAVYADSIMLLCPDSYTIFRIWTLDDGCSNSTTQIQTISVSDTTSPSFTVPLDITVYDCGADTTVVNTGDVLDESDNCSTGIQATYYDSVIGGCTGSYTISRTWSLSDNCGNTTSQVQTIMITDTISPTFTIPSDTTVYDCNADTSAIFIGNVVDEYDNCSTNLEAIYTDVVVGNCNGNYVITRLWRLFDDCGNSSNGIQLINIIDTISPTFTVPPDTIVYSDINCFADTTVLGVGDVIDEFDPCDSSVEASYVDLISPLCQGSYMITRTWTSSDDCGNSRTLIQNIQVLDTLGPSFLVPSDTTLYVSSACLADTSILNTGMPSSISDNCSSVLEQIYTDSLVTFLDSNLIYQVNRTWQFIDDCGNSRSDLQIISILDTSAFFASFVPADTTIYCGESIPPVEDPIFSSYCDTLPILDFVEIRIDSTCIENYSLLRTWTAEIAPGLIDSVSQLIRVQECGPTIMASSIQQRYCLNESIILNSSYSSPGGYTYYPQWEFTSDTTSSWMPIAGGDIDNYTFTSDASSSGWYRVSYSSDSIYSNQHCDYKSLPFPIDIQISNPPSFVTQVICEGDQYSFGGTDYSLPGEYAHTFNNRYGCDSLVTLRLVIFPTSANTINVDICVGEYYQTSNGDQFYNSGIYQDTLSNTFGCDSILTINLNVHPPTQSNISSVICFNESYQVGDNYYDATGIYTDTLTTPVGCDSIVVLDLTVLEDKSSNQAVQICYGESHMIGTNSYSASGIYMDTLTAANGCDSIVTLDLLVLDQLNSSFNISLCQGESFIFNSKSFDTDGSYQEILTSTSGCDSTVTLNIVTILPIQTSQRAMLCQGDTLSIWNQAISQEGTYSQTFTSQIGCDSIVTLEVLSIPTSSSFQQKMICLGDSINIGGLFRKTYGLYDEVYVSSNGCDSVVTTEVFFESQIELLADDVFACPGEEVMLIVNGPTNLFWTQNNLLSCLDCPNPVANVSENTTFTVNAIGCYDEILSKDIQVTFYEPTPIDLSTDTSIRQGTSLLLEYVPEDLTSIINWYDNAGTLLCGDCHYVDVTPMNEQYYFAESIGKNGCVTTDSILVRLRNDCAEARILAANYMTPNGDGANDEFEIRFLGLQEIVSLKIFNRWGQLVFESSDIENNKWDGTVNGQPANPGVFVYKIDYICLDGEPNVKSGNVTVLN